MILHMRCRIKADDVYHTTSTIAIIIYIYLSIHSFIHHSIYLSINQSMQARIDKFIYLSIDASMVTLIYLRIES